MTSYANDDYGSALADYFSPRSAQERAHADRECERLRVLDSDCKDAHYWWERMGAARAVPAMANVNERAA
jgi:hypothetical protein